MVAPNLTISAESVCYLIVIARQHDVQDVATDEDAASNSTDDGMTGELEGRRRSHPEGDRVVHQGAQSGGAG